MTYRADLIATSLASLPDGVRTTYCRFPGVAAISGSLLLGLFVMFLEIFVAFLQAYIFTALTAVFIGLIRHAH